MKKAPCLLHGAQRKFLDSFFTNIEPTIMGTTLLSSKTKKPLFCNDPILVRVFNQFANKLIVLLKNAGLRTARDGSTVYFIRNGKIHFARLYCRLGPWSNSRWPILFRIKIDEASRGDAHLFSDVEHAALPDLLPSVQLSVLPSEAMRFVAWTGRFILEGTEPDSQTPIRRTSHPGSNYYYAFSQSARRAADAAEI